MIDFLVPDFFAAIIMLLIQTDVLCDSKMTEMEMVYNLLLLWTEDRGLWSLPPLDLI